MQAIVRNFGVVLLLAILHIADVRADEPQSAVPDSVIATPHASAPAADVTLERLRRADQEPGQWMANGRGIGATFFSPPTQINTATVSRFGFAWQFKTGTFRGMEATPLVVDGVLYVSGIWGRVYAVDAVTGARRWEFDPHADPSFARWAGSDVTTRGLTEDAFGRLDVLVNNAGYAFIGAVEEGTPEEYRPMFETNVFGLIETTRAALPALRRTGGGRIVNLSSIAGFVAWAGSGLYAATKFAVEGVSEALAQEVAPFGIAVIIVEPGAFRTELGKQAGDPKKAIAVILKAVDFDSPPLHLPLGQQAYGQARAKLASFAQTMDEWEAVAAATEFDV